MKSSSNSVVIAIVIVGLFITSGLLLLSGVGGTLLAQRAPLVRTIQTSHAPIGIDGEGDFTAANGVIDPHAAGTAGDPYVIEGLDINGSGADYCLSIGNTTAHFVVRDCTLHHARQGVALSNVRNGSLDANNVLENDGDGIHLSSCQYVTLSGNTIVENGGDGVDMDDSSDTTVEGNNISANSGDGVDLDGCDRISVANNSVADNARGLRLHRSEMNTIADNTVSAQGGDGIYLDDASGTTVARNSVIDNGDGVVLIWSDENTFTENTASENERDGIYLLESSDNTLRGNRVSNNSGNGIALDSSNLNTLAENTATDNDDAGISVAWSEQNTLERNAMVGCGISLLGDRVSEWNSHSIQTSNTVNDEPVYYWADHTGGTVPAGAGTIILANCNGVTVEDQSLCETTVGLSLGFTNDTSIVDIDASSNRANGIFLYESYSNTLANNTASNNGAAGIYLYQSNDNTLRENTASENDGYGYRLYFAEENTLANNTASNNTGGKLSGGYLLLESGSNTLAYNDAIDNDDGIALSGSDENTIRTNRIARNRDIGIMIFYDSADNLLYRNAFIDNAQPAYDNGSNNVWTQTGWGNYWSDASVGDANEDGIADSAYSIPGTAQATDAYPLLAPFTPNTPPVAEVKMEGEAVVGQPCTMSASASHDPDGELTHYRWEVWTMDGTLLDTQTGSPFTHTFVESGTFTVKLTVTDDSGARSTTVRTVQAGPAKQDKDGDDSDDGGGVGVGTGVFAGIPIWVMVVIAAIAVGIVVMLVLINRIA